MRIIQRWAVHAYLFSCRLYLLIIIKYNHGFYQSRIFRVDQNDRKKEETIKKEFHKLLCSVLNFFSLSGSSDLRPLYLGQTFDEFPLYSLLMNHLS